MGDAGVTVRQVDEVAVHGADTVGDAIAGVRPYRAGREYWFAEGCFIDELHNESDDPAMSVARARLPVGGRTRWHRLHGTAERYLIERGHGLVEVGTQPPRQVGPGDLVVIPPLCRQRIANAGDDDLVFLALCTPRFRPGNYEDVDADADSGSAAGSQANGAPSDSERPASP